MKWKKAREQPSQLPLPLEKGDLPALIIAALISLLPAVLFVGGILALAMWLIFLD